MGLRGVAAGSRRGEDGPRVSRAPPSLALDARARPARRRPAAEAGPGPCWDAGRPRAASSSVVAARRRPASAVNSRALMGADRTSSSGSGVDRSIAGRPERRTPHRLAADACLPFSLTGGKNAPRLVRMRRCRVGAAWAADPGERIETWRTVVGASCWSPKAWIQAVVLVILVRVLHPRAARLPHLHGAPAGARSASSTRRAASLYTGTDISKGQQVFLHNGLMEYGSAFGHGAYLGPGLHRRLPAPLVRSRQARLRRRPRRTPRRAGRSRTSAPTATTSAPETLTLTAPQAQAFRALVPYYSRFFSDPTTEHGLRPNAITDRTQLRQLTAFFAWTAWAASTDRPGHDYSYTNNWPPEPRVDNTADGQRDRLVGAVADRAAGRHRHPVRRLRALGAQAGLARPRAGDAVVPRARRRRAHARAARVRVVLLRDGGAVPAPDARRRRRRSTTAPRSTASSASTWRRSSRTT